MTKRPLHRIIVSGQIGLTVPMSLMAIIIMTACSSDSSEEMEQQTVTIEASASATDYDEVPKAGTEARADDAANATRAWNPPDGFYLYDTPSLYGLFSNQRNLTDQSIYLFLTKGKTTPSIQGRLRKKGDKWKYVNGETDLEKMLGDYQAYGFIPRDAAGTSEVALLDDEEGTTFANGTILTIHGLHPVTASDVCVVIGAKKGFVEGTDDKVYYDGEYTDADKDGHYDVGEPRSNRVTPGEFDFEIKSGDNNLFLLFDHLYSALRFCYKVDETYDALRTIVLKKVELKAKDVMATYDATVTLRANDTGASPISSLEFTPTGTTPADFETIYEDATGLTLSHTDYTTTIMGCSVPGDREEFVIRSTYDIYDKKGNLTRQNCTAENQFNVHKIIGRPVILERGKYYTINLTVMPTYLWVMSDPDADGLDINIE